MNEITYALRAVNTAIKTVKIVDLIKKTTIVISIIVCCVSALRFFRK